MFKITPSNSKLINILNEISTYIFPFILPIATILSTDEKSENEIEKETRIRAKGTLKFQIYSGLAAIIATLTILATSSITSITAAEGILAITMLTNGATILAVIALIILMFLPLIRIIKAIFEK